MIINQPKFVDGYTYYEIWRRRLKIFAYILSLYGGIIESITILQKLVYFINRLNIRDFNYFFFEYNFGPYSFDLSYDVRFAKNENLIRKKIEYKNIIRNPGKERGLIKSIKIIPNRKKIQEFLTSFNARFILNDKEIKEITNIIDFFRGLGSRKKIELAASILWLLDNNLARTIDETLYLIMKWKKDIYNYTDRYTTAEFFNVWKELEKFGYIPAYINTNSRIINKCNNKVLLAGCDDVKLEAESSHYPLKGLGKHPLWFHSEFPISNQDTMEHCLMNVRKSSYFLMFLKNRYGLPYRNGKYSILEQEFLTAYKNNKSILIFIEKETYDQSKIYHHFKNKNVSKECLGNLGLKADLKLYEFIERIQHMKVNGKYKIPWIIPYNSLEDITKQIKYKWGGS